MSLWMLSSSCLSVISSILLIVCSMSYECLLSLFYSYFGMILWYPPLTVHMNRLGTCLAPRGGAATPNTPLASLSAYKLPFDLKAEGGSIVFQKEFHSA